MEPTFAQWQRDYGESVKFILVSDVTQKEALLDLAKAVGIDVLLQEHDELAKAYQAYGTPAAVLIDPDGTIGITLKMGSAAIEHLVLTTVSNIGRIWAIPSESAARSIVIDARSFFN